MGLITSNASSLALGFTFPIVCAAVVFVRFYMRRRRGVALLVDDWLCLPALMCLVGICITIIYSVKKNVLLNSEIPDTDTVDAKQRAFAAVTGATPILWLIGASCIKLSILLFYRRIFVGRVFNTVSWGLISFNALWTIYAFLSWLLYCGRHVHANFAGPWTACPEYGQSLQIAVFIWDSFIDLCMIVLPIPFVARLQMPGQRKFEIVIAFLMGGFAIVASILNTTLQVMSMLDSTITTTDDPNSSGPDLSYYYWQTIELGVGLITCNLPTLQPLYNAALVQSWTAAVATKRSFASWRSHYNSALSSSRNGNTPSYPSRGVRLGSGHAYDGNSKIVGVNQAEIELSPVGEEGRLHGRSESTDYMC